MRWRRRCSPRWRGRSRRRRPSDEEDLARRRRGAHAPRRRAAPPPPGRAGALARRGAPAPHGDDPEARRGAAPRVQPAARLPAVARLGRLLRRERARDALARGDLRHPLRPGRDRRGPRDPLALGGALGRRRGGDLAAARLLLAGGARLLAPVSRDRARAALALARALAAAPRRLRRLRGERVPGAPHPSLRGARARARAAARLALAARRRDAAPPAGPARGGRRGGPPLGGVDRLELARERADRAGLPVGGAGLARDPAGARDPEEPRGAGLRPPGGEHPGLLQAVHDPRLPGAAPGARDRGPGRARRARALALARRAGRDPRARAAPRGARRGGPLPASRALVRLLRRPDLRGRPLRPGRLPRPRPPPRARLREARARRGARGAPLLRGGRRQARALLHAPALRGGERALARGGRRRRPPRRGRRPRPLHRLPRRDRRLLPAPPRLARRGRALRGAHGPPLHAASPPHAPVEPLLQRRPSRADPLRPRGDAPRPARLPRRARPRARDGLGRGAARRPAAPEVQGDARRGARARGLPAGRAPDRAGARADRAVPAGRLGGRLEIGLRAAGRSSCGARPRRAKVLELGLAAVHIALCIPDLEGGGAQRSMVDLAGGFAARGHRVDLLAIRPRGELRDALAPGVRLVPLGGALTRLPMVSGSKRRRALAAVPALARYLRAERPDALVATSHSTNVAASVAGRLVRRPTRVVLRFDSQLSRSPRLAGTRMQRRRERRARRYFPWADAWVAISEGVADDAARVAGIPRARIAAIHNPVVTEELLRRARAPVDDAWLTPGRPPVVLGVGRLVAQKDFATLVRAFAQVRARREARLLVLGEGPERAGLERLASELGVGADVRFAGRVPDAPAYMARAAVFALSSAWEGFGRVVVEALAVGCPVASTDCPSGPREILAGGAYGPLVPVGDAEALAGAIASLLERPPPRERLLERAQAFTLERGVERYLEVLRG